jgi:uncharacterized protein (DUF433 family)
MAAETRTSTTAQGAAGVDRADPADAYRYLERRPHPWRKQLYLKGRNMTVGHLVYDMRTNSISMKEAAANYDLPLEQIEEALAYYRRHRDVVEADAAEERRRLETRGIALDPPPPSTRRIIGRHDRRAALAYR